MSLRRRLAELEAATTHQDEPPMITPEMDGEEAARVYRMHCQYRGRYKQVSGWGGDTYQQLLDQ
jgi:hypothetical protein